MQKKQAGLFRPPNIRSERHAKNLFHRYVAMHRLPGMSDRLQGMERTASQPDQTAGIPSESADLNPNNYKLVRFSEYLDGETVRWVFFPDQCRHCQDPPCISVGGALVDGAMIHDPKTGAVVYTEKTSKISKKNFEEIRESCPYNIPRRDAKTGRISKCTMCYDRIDPWLAAGLCEGLPHRHHELW